MTKNELLIRQLSIALRESLFLQAHYAKCLNDLDGGERHIFPEITEWINRLKEIGKL